MRIFGYMGKQFNKQLLVLLLSASYLFVTLTHINFIQRYHLSAKEVSSPYGSVLKMQSAFGSFPASFKRIAKTLPKKYKMVRECVAVFTRSFFDFSTARIQEDAVQPDSFFLTRNNSALSLLCCLRL